MDLLDETAVNYQIVLTKTDKIKPTVLEKTVEATVGAINRRPGGAPLCPVNLFGNRRRHQYSARGNCGADRSVSLVNHLLTPPPAF